MYYICLMRIFKYSSILEYVYVGHMDAHSINLMITNLRVLTILPLIVCGKNIYVTCDVIKNSPVMSYDVMMI